jgi:hypothetical protein
VAREADTRRLTNHRPMKEAEAEEGRFLTADPGSQTMLF